jgi:hypothetical protein
MLTLKEVALRTQIAQGLYLSEIEEAFERVVSELAADLIQAIGLGRCERPEAACRMASRLLCLNADEDCPQ